MTRIWQYLTGIATAAVLLLYAWLQSERAQRSNDDAERAEAARKRTQDVAQEIVDGEADAAQEIADAKQNARVRRGYFSE